MLIVNCIHSWDTRRFVCIVCIGLETDTYVEAQRQTHVQRPMDTDTRADAQRHRHTWVNRHFSRAHCTNIRVRRDLLLYCTQCTHIRVRRNPLLYCTLCTHIHIRNTNLSGPTLVKVSREIFQHHLARLSLNMSDSSAHSRTGGTASSLELFPG